MAAREAKQPLNAGRRCWSYVRIWPACASCMPKRPLPLTGGTPPTRDGHRSRQPPFEAQPNRADYGAVAVTIGW